ncbi:P-loop containing nucleoside triphosphate hydrolase protein [Papiliotrema laurentii]|uniref:RNA helicase n=1 Tax=Papiliotrema laurentii TaxID=5418 RepID=A0AAD9CU91_PAPLA|nr:P-loop containing nucleoside triphosphate hydrolase protein [Papiliotrema laurentii]
MPESAGLTPRKKDWADDDSSDDGGETLRREFGSPPKAKSTEPSQPQKDNSGDAPVASLLSRIGGLSTNPNDYDEKSSPPPSSSQPQQPAQTSQPPKETGSAVRPKPNISNPLFGRALAGVKSDRAASASSPAPTPASSAPAPAAEAVTTAPEEKKDEKKDEKKPVSETPKEGKMDDAEGWGSAPDTTDKTNGDAKAAENYGDMGGEGAAADERMSMGSGLISNDFKVEVKLADLQADVNSPLYSAKTFEELPIHDDLKKGIYAAGFKKPSKIQERALPLLLTNPPRNLIGQSQSGTGKTAAFTLDMLSRVDPAIVAPQAICLAPSRELARQIQEVVDRIGQFTQISTFLAVPQAWKRGVKIDKHILIGTPGTVLDMLTRGGNIFDPRLIRVFVLDEADEMIAQQTSGAGLGDQTLRIKRALSRDAQIVLFSATFPDRVRDFAERIAPEANQIYLKQEDVTVDAIKQLWLECDGEEGKFETLSLLYELMTIGQSIVFCRRKDTADRIAQRLTEDGHSVASLHGGKEHTDRDQVLDTFRNGQTKVLITTNVVARGIDISQVNMVVNYDVPTIKDEYGGGWDVDIESYIHRIGRTGRFGRKGCSIIFAHDARSQSEIQEIQNRLGGKPMKKIDARNPDDVDQLEKALKLAMKGPA